MTSDDETSKLAYYNLHSYLFAINIFHSHKDLFHLLINIARCDIIQSAISIGLQRNSLTGINL